MNLNIKHYSSLSSVNNIMHSIEISERRYKKRNSLTLSYCKKSAKNVLRAVHKTRYCKVLRKDTERHISNLPSMQYTCTGAVFAATLVRSAVASSSLFSSCGTPEYELCILLGVPQGKRFNTPCGRACVCLSHRKLQLLPPCSAIAFPVL